MKAAAMPPNTTWQTPQQKGLDRWYEGKLPPQPEAPCATLHSPELLDAINGSDGDPQYTLRVIAAEASSSSSGTCLCPWELSQLHKGFFHLTARTFVLAAPGGLATCLTRNRQAMLKPYAVGRDPSSRPRGPNPETPGDLDVVDLISAGR